MYCSTSEVIDYTSTLSFRSGIVKGNEQASERENRLRRRNVARVSSR